MMSQAFWAILLVFITATASGCSATATSFLAARREQRGRNKGLLREAYAKIQMLFISASIPVTEIETINKRYVGSEREKRDLVKERGKRCAEVYLEVLQAFSTLNLIEAQKSERKTNKKALEEFTTAFMITNPEDKNEVSESLEKMRSLLAKMDNRFAKFAADGHVF